MPDLSSSPAVSATLSRALDTVAAVSTPPGRGGVALIRISGPDAAGIGRRIFFPAGAAHPDERPRTAVYGRIRRPGGAEPGEYIDTGLAVFFRAPGSFTGEDTLEITCHGGILVTRAVLAAALAAGARQAERGEFTRRAFASGRIDLTEAEALGLLIDAGTDAQLRLSHSGMNGKLAEACSSLRDGITSLLADIYVRIDFPEEDLGSMPDAELAERLSSLTEKTDALRMSYRTGRAVAEGIPAVICGNTNTGKSTLFNRFTGRDDAIVTDIAGTTRDTLTAKVAAGDVTLLLSDTAGIHGGPADPVEAIGMDRARAGIAGAELILYMIDGSAPPSDDDLLLAGSLRDGREGETVALLSKSDLPAHPDAVSLWETFPHRLRVSPLDGSGFGDLVKTIEELFIDGSIDIAEDAVVASARQRDALDRAADGLRAARKAMEDGYTADILSVCLEDAAGALSELDGRGAGAVSADVTEKIFSSFCVGK